MPVFITEMVARGFWWAILASIIFGTVFSVLGFFLGKINKILGSIVQYLSSTLFLFYIWHIRHGAGWLILGIFAAVGFVIRVIVVAFAKKLNVTDGNKVTNENIASS